MRSWSAPEVPRLPGKGRPPRVHDSAAREVRATDPRGTARMYVCGITPYDATHLGHAFTYLTFDLVQRVWRDAGLDVHYVQNVTDVDDPLLERANERGLDWRELAGSEIELFRTDMAALRIIPPREFIGVVEAVPLVAEMVETLRSRGAAYDVDGDIYFPVDSDPNFGAVSGFDRATMLELSAERGGDPDRHGKKDPLDPLLWRAARPGEPSWESSLGPGRPGWHVECSAISLANLGMTFDVEGGGSDLVFPHHEMSASHAQVATGEFPHAQAYVHVAMVGLDGEKMSKSRGNLVLVSKLRGEDGMDPMAVRLALLDHHYRTEWEWTPADRPSAEHRLATWRRAVAAETAPPAEGVLQAVRDRLSDDLDTPGALRVIDGWAHRTLTAPIDTPEPPTPDAPTLIRDTVDALLGIAL